jgi:monoamine oxidase
MSADERSDPSAKLATYLGPALAAVGDVHSKNWLNVGSDTIALDDFTVSSVCTEKWREGCLVELLGCRRGSLRKLQHPGVRGNGKLHSVVPPKFADSPAENDQLPRAFATALGKRVMYQAVVRRIDSRVDELVVGYQDLKGVQQQIRADVGVCTIPFPVLRNST